jgi:cytochrome c oxidase assembly protein subunit 11
VLGKVSGKQNDDKTKKYCDGGCIGVGCGQYLCLCGDAGHVKMTEGTERKNTRLAIILVLVGVAMFGFGYGLVPLYNVLCDITGINGKTNTQAVKELVYQVDTKRDVKIEFLTTLNEKTPLTFWVEKNTLLVHPGQYYTVNFYAENKTDKPLLVRAIDSVSPGLTKDYFKKTVCFCFSQQTFKPHERKTMPVRFVVEPSLPAQYKTITLSYTFFDNTDNSVNK